MTAIKSQEITALKKAKKAIKLAREQMKLAAGTGNPAVAFIAIEILQETSELEKKITHLNYIAGALK